MSVADEIKKFKELLDMGAITQEEFDKKKKELIYNNQEISEKDELDNSKKETEEIILEPQRENTKVENEAKDMSHSTIKSNSKDTNSNKAINELTKIIKKIFKGAWTVLRYFIAILFIFVGFLGEPISLLFGISLLPLTYKLISKYAKDKLSKKTMAIVKQNIIFAITIKVLVLILSAIGLSTMWEAVFADVGVSIIAIINALRMLKIK